jgi:Tol biopolymer transport system component
MQKFIVSALICALCLIMLPAAVEAASQGKIAFVKDSDIWLINPDGSGATRLTRNGNSGNPIWSRDGKRIAFAGKDGCIWTMKADGSEQKPTPIKVIGEYFCWSPDGSELLFSSLRDKAICAVDLSGKRKRIIINGDPYVFCPSLNPDGSLLIYSAGNYEVCYTTKLGLSAGLTAASKPERMTRYPSGGPVLSRDGMKIAFDQGNSIWVMDVTGKNPGKVVDGNENLSCKMPDWSPDGKQIVFRVDGPGGVHLRTVDLATKDVKILIKGKGLYTSPHWGP